MEKLQGGNSSLILWNLSISSCLVEVLQFSASLIYVLLLRVSVKNHDSV